MLFFLFILVLLDFSDCRHIEKRNALLIVGNASCVVKSMMLTDAGSDEPLDIRIVLKTVKITYPDRSPVAVRPTV